MFRLISLLTCLLAAATAQAQLGHEIAQKHAARAGESLAQLTALRVEGRTFINEEVVPFTLIAQRPNRLRVESFSPLRRVIQVYEGAGHPWISHSEIKGGAPLEMVESEAREFMANADFDGPLVNFAAKGYSVDYAGEDIIEERKAYKLLLMNKGDEVFFLWVDRETFEVVKRTVYRAYKDQRVTVDTFFRDFRRVGGVLQPFRIESSANGRKLYVMLVDRMEPNPAGITPENFARPIDASP